MYFFHLRPASYPYITGDGFRAMADHIYDEITKVKEENVKEGDIVFINSSLVEEYFKKIHKNIKHRYILISHNSDKNITEDHLKYLDDKIIKWYAQNVLVKDPKINPIPFGLAGLSKFMKSGKDSNNFRDRFLEKKLFILIHNPFS